MLMKRKISWTICNNCVDRKILKRIYHTYPSSFISSTFWWVIRLLRSHSRHLQEKVHIIKMSNNKTATFTNVSKIWLFHDWVQAIDACTRVITTHSLCTDVFLHGFTTLLDQAILSSLTPRNRIRFSIILVAFFYII